MKMLVWLENEVGQGLGLPLPPLVSGAAGNEMATVWAPVLLFLLL